LHRLQLLDVSCFSPLKRAYSYKVDDLVSNYINYITKLEFLAAFKAAFYKAITESNICASFQATSIVPYNPGVVLSRLDVVVRTPSPAALLEPTWVDQTPSNARKLDAQSSLVVKKIRRNEISLIDSLSRLTKGAKKIMCEATLLKNEVSTLQKANNAATKRRGRKKIRLQKHGSLTVAEGAKLAAQKAATQQLEDERRQNVAQSGGSRQAIARCRRCREPGHNSRTCKNDTVDTAEH
jgi:hypothetical protein